MARFKHEGLALITKYPAFGRYWALGGLSVFGDQVGWIALVWLALQVGGSAAAVGIVTFLYLAPQAFLAPIAGIWLDRLPKARIMAIANVIVGAIFVAIPLVSSHAGRHGLVVIYILVTLAGMVLPFDAIGASPLIGELIPEEQWSQAYFLTQTQGQVATLVGPALGGILVAIMGTESLLYVDAVTFFAVAAALLSLPSTGAPIPSQISSQASASSSALASSQASASSRTSTSSQALARRSVIGEFLEALRFLKNFRAIVALAVISFFFYFLYGPYNVVLPILAKTRYGGSTEFGLLWAVFSAGSLAGSLVFSSIAWKHRLSVTLASIITLCGIITFALAFTHSFALALVIMFLGGIEYAPWVALVITARQKMVPQELQARITGVTSAITAGGEPLGALIAGLLLHNAGAFLTLLYAGAATILLGIAALSWPAFRQLDNQSSSAAAARTTQLS